jgi:hypothetical protein
MRLLCRRVVCVFWAAAGGCALPRGGSLSVRSGLAWAGAKKEKNWHRFRLLGDDLSESEALIIALGLRIWNIENRRTESQLF